MSSFISVVQAVALPTVTQNNLPAFVSSIYSFALTVVGLAILVQAIRAGFKMLTAAGNTAKIGEGRKMITNAVIGAILLFAAYLILNIINPDLVKNTFNFSLPKTASTSVGNPNPQTNPTNGSAVATGVARTVTSFHFGLPVAKAQAGVSVFTVRVTDADGDYYDQDYDIEIAENVVGSLNYYGKTTLSGHYHPNSGIARAADTGGSSTLVIITPFMPNGVIGQPYYATITAVGGRQPYRYSIVDGSLPEGLVLQNADETPSLSIKNQTATRDPNYFYYQGDKFAISLINAKPNSQVEFKWLKDNSPAVFAGITSGMTDASGSLSLSGAASDIGNWHGWAVVDGKMSSVIGFQVVAQAIHVNTDPSVSPVVNTSYGGSGTFTPCTLHLYCQNKTGPVATFSPGPSGCGPNANEVEECFYPTQDPNSVCRQLYPELQNCISTYNSPSLSTDQAVSSLPACGSAGLKPGDPCLIKGINAVTKTPYISKDCSFSNQTQAIYCGYPAGTYCLPGYGAAQGNTGCVSPPQTPTGQ